MAKIELNLTKNTNEAIEGTYGKHYHGGADRAGNDLVHGPRPDSTVSASRGD